MGVYGLMVVVGVGECERCVVPITDLTAHDIRGCTAQHRQTDLEVEDPGAAVDEEAVGAVDLLGQRRALGLERLRESIDAFGRRWQNGKSVSDDANPYTSVAFPPLPLPWKKISQRTFSINSNSGAAAPAGAADAAATAAGAGAAFWFSRLDMISPKASLLEVG